MHATGINHRDCYICHFLLHLPFTGNEEQLKISVIDLHRAQLRNSVPIRWRNKDLIGLYYSSLNIGLTQRDVLRFMKVYFGLSLRDILQQEASLIAKAAKLHKLKNVQLESHCKSKKEERYKCSSIKKMRLHNKLIYRHLMRLLIMTATYFYGIDRNFIWMWDLRFSIKNQF